MRVKLILVTFYLNGVLHADYIEKPPERMSNFWTVRLFKPNPNRISVFCTSLVVWTYLDYKDDADWVTWCMTKVTDGFRQTEPPKKESSIFITIIIILSSFDISLLLSSLNC